MDTINFYIELHNNGLSKPVRAQKEQQINGITQMANEGLNYQIR